jgi:hypothetical protein
MFNCDSLFPHWNLGLDVPLTAIAFSPTKLMKSTICVAEDRESCEPSLKLLLLSLNAHCHEAAVSLFYPPANDAFLAWLKKCPQVRLQTSHLKNGYGWNVKPQAIMQMIHNGFDEVVWIDSDIVVNRNLFTVVSGLTRNILLVAEHTLAQERWDRNALRARLSGLQIGRVLPFAVSSGGKYSFDPRANLTEDSRLLILESIARLRRSWHAHWDAQKPICVEKSPNNLLRRAFYTRRVAN